MKRLLLFSLFTFHFFSIVHCSLLIVNCSLCHAQEANPVSATLERLQAGMSKRFVVEIDKQSGEDFFSLEGGGKRVKVTANSWVNAAFGVNWYLKYHLGNHLSFCESRMPRLPKQLPEIHERHTTPLAENFYMNYCTFSYTTAFWDWSRWEQEIDLMALNGVTIPMAVVGAEAVWMNTLLRFGYTRDEVKQFLCGPAYFGWLLMGNLETLGGPLPDEWFGQHIELQHKILARMREYGMKPMMQGFYGMVPSTLQQKYPDATIVEQGLWNGLQRPPVLAPTDPLFAEMAAVWYEEQERLFGHADYFGGDLFHEGGLTGGLDVTACARSVQQAMLRHNPDAVWVIQSWSKNPKPELLAGMDRRHSLIVDLCAEFWDRWRERNGFDGFPWLWSHITNYGANVGLHGRIDKIATEPILARHDTVCSPSMKGTGSTSEGIEVNPVVFDLMSEMRWRDTQFNLDDWLAQYARRRYGSGDANLAEAWRMFHQTAYGTYEKHRRPSESVFCARPRLDKEKITASTWSQCRTFYDTKRYADAVGIFLQSADRLKDEPTYQYDAIDFVRQYIADLGRQAYYHFVDAYEAKDKEQFIYWSSRFLQLIEDQDRLLSTHPRFHVARWLGYALRKSDDPANRNLYEHNARMLIGTWTEEPTPVRDYAHKEWGGMLRDYYLPRWTRYVSYLNARLNGHDESEPDYFPEEKFWVNDHTPYVFNSKDNPVEVAKILYEKYHN